MSASYECELCSEPAKERNRLCEKHSEESRRQSILDNSWVPAEKAIELIECWRDGGSRKELMCAEMLALCLGPMAKGLLRPRSHFDSLIAMEEMLAEPTKPGDSE